MHENSDKPEPRRQFELTGLLRQKPRPEPEVFFYSCNLRVTQGARWSRGLSEGLLLDFSAYVG